MKKTLLDPKQNGEYPFQYTPAVKTDVRETIERARRKLAEEQEAPRVRKLALRYQQGGWVLSIFVMLPACIVAASVLTLVFIVLFNTFIAGSAV